MFKEVVQTKDLLLGHYTGKSNRGINNTIEQKRWKSCGKTKFLYTRRVRLDTNTNIIIHSTA